MPASRRSPPAARFVPANASPSPVKRRCSCFSTRGRHGKSVSPYGSGKRASRSGNIPGKPILFFQKGLKAGRRFACPISRRKQRQEPRRLDESTAVGKLQDKECTARHCAGNTRTPRKR